MEKMEKCPFTEPPPKSATLQELCCRRVSEYISHYDFETITGLPAPVLDALKFYVAPRTLHDLTAALKQKGIDASQAWKKHILDALGESVTFPLEFGYTDDRHHFIVHRNACPFHQKYISKHCEILIRKLTNSKKVEEGPQIHDSLLHFLPSVVYLKLTMESFEQLTEWKDVLEPLFLNLETLILIVCKRYNQSLIKRTAMLLQKFCEYKHLRGIIFESRNSGFCLVNSSGEPKVCICDLFRALDESFAAKNKSSTLSVNFSELENSTEDTSDDDKNQSENFAFEADCKVSENSLFDVAVSSVMAIDETNVANTTKSHHDWESIDTKISIKETSQDEGHEFEKISSGRYQRVAEKCLSNMSARTFLKSENSFCEVLKNIDMAQKYSFENIVQSGEENALESIHIGCCDLIHASGNFLPWWNKIRRLNLGQDFGYYPLSEKMTSDVLLKVGYHQLTHLRMSHLYTKGFLPKMLFILCEYYRVDWTPARAMELVNLTGIRDNPSSEELALKVKSACEINAVKNLCLKDVTMHGEASLRELTFFLSRNACLTSLRLWNNNIVGENGTLIQLPLIHILESIVESKVLQTLSLHGCWNSSIESRSLLTVLSKLLHSVQTLKTLEMDCCQITGNLVTSSGFIEAIQQHPSLTVLSLTNNKLGSSGADFLVLLFGTDRDLSLKELDISKCRIPGRALHSAAQSLNETSSSRPLLNKLNISGMLLEDRRPGGAEHISLITEFKTLVSLLDARYFGDGMADHIANM